MKVIELVNDLIIQKAYAGSLGQALSDNLDQVKEAENAESLVQGIINFAVPLSVTCVFVLLVYAGYILISSQGNPDKLQEGKEIITNALIGFAVVLLSVVILLLIANTFDISLAGY